MQETWSSNQPPSVLQKASLPYRDTRSYQNRTQQSGFSPRLYAQQHSTFSPGQQEVVSNCNVPQTLCSNTNTFVPFQQNLCDGPTNQSFSQQMFTGHPQHFMSSNGSVHHGQVNTQSCSYICTQQNYRNPGPANTDVGPEQVLKYWTSYHGRSRLMAEANDNTRDWRCHVSDNGRFCISNQQQPVSPRPTNLQHQLHQHSGQQQTPGRLLIYQGQGGTTVCYAYDSSVTLTPAGPEKNISSPFINCQQSQTELNSTQSVSDLNSSGHTHIKACNINQSSPEQCNSPFKPDLNLQRYVNSKLHQLLCSDDRKQGFYNGLASKMQSSDNRTVCNSGSKHSFSELNSQSVVEPPSKIINRSETQRGYFNQLPTTNTNVSKDNIGLISQSAVTDPHQKGRIEQNPTGQRQSRTGQSEIIYSTDPADCLEAVFALQKSLQQVNRAVAIVPPISQQPSNPEEMHNVSPRVVDSPPLKISAVWSLSEVCDSQSPVTKINDKLTHDPSPTVGQDDKTVNNITDTLKTECTEVSSTNLSAGHQNNMLQKDCDLSDDVFELSSVPVVGYTLEELMKLVKCLETTASQTACTEKPESVCHQILEMFWNGNEENLMKHVKALDKVRRYSVVESVKNYKSVVFESVTPENLKKVSNCAVVNNTIFSLSEKFKSSWLNVGAQPADIAKVLSEPLPDDITLPRDTSQITSNFTQVTEITSLSAEEHVMSEDPEDVCTSSEENAENGGKKTVTQNKVHSDTDTPGVALLCHVPNQQETFKKPYDMQHQNTSLNTKPTDLSPVADMCSEEFDFCISTQEVLKSAPLFVQQTSSVSEQPQDKLSVSDSLSVCPIDKPHNDSTSTMEIEDVSDDESNGSLVMGITVLSSEDALKFFQQFEKEPQRNMEIAADVRPSEDMSLLTENQTPNLPRKPNPEQNEAKICSLCGTNCTVKFSYNYMTHNDRLFCSMCWDKYNKTDVLHRKQLGQDQSPPSLEPELSETFPASAVAQSSDEVPAEKLEGESSKSVQVKTSDIKIELKVTKDENSENTSVPRPQLLPQSNKTWVSKSIKSRQERQDPSFQAETDKSSLKSPETSGCLEATLELGENPPVKKMKTNQTRKVHFALYGSNFKHQCEEQGQNFSPPASLIVSDTHRDSWKNQRLSQNRRFSAPATLSLSTACKDFSAASSARQKVHDRWSSAFISTFPPKSPQKKKMQKSSEVLKTNMMALKEHLKHRTMILSDQEPQKH